MKSLKRILAFMLVLVVLASALPSAFADEPITNVMLKVYPNVNYGANQVPLVGQNASDIQIKPTSNVTVSSWYVTEQSTGSTVTGKLTNQPYVLHVSVIAMGGYSIDQNASTSVNNESAFISVTGGNAADISWTFNPALQAPTVYHHPTGESHKVGETFSFTATCSDPDAEYQWYIYDQMNSRYTVAEMQSAYPQMQFVESRLENDTVRLNIHNAIEGIDGWTVACCFTNDAGIAWTERAECSISGEITVVATPTPTSTPEAVEVLDIPVITKHPASESASVGGSLHFTAHADNASSVQWFIVSADGNATVSADGASNSYPGITVSGCYEDTLVIDNVISELNGCSVYAVFTSSAGDQVKTFSASIEVSSTITIVDSGTCGDNLKWNLDSSGILTISGSGLMYDYSYTTTDTLVTTAPWGQYADTIEKVCIEDGVSNIGEYSFYGCKFFTSVDIANSVTSISGYSFYNCCNLTAVTISPYVTSIGDYSFSECRALADVTLAYGIETIGSYAFQSCRKLESIRIPDSVTDICEGAFQYCRKLSDVTLSNKMTELKNGVFCGCWSLCDIDIPKSITTIGSSFSDCGFKEFVIPDSVTRFAGLPYCKNLVYIDIPSSVEITGDTNFCDCASLESVNIESSITLVKFRMFLGCTSLKSISIPDTVTLIGMMAFNECTSLCDVFYMGDESHWNAIQISTLGNESLELADVYFNGKAPVTFDANGGEGAPSTQYKEFRKDLTLSDAVPTRDGLTFIGWSEDPNATIARYQAGGLYTEDKSATLYAVWSDCLIASGICGDDLTWTIDGNSVLTITGTGSMYDYNYIYDGGFEKSTAPWWGYQNSIVDVNIESGITSIGQCAFCRFSNIQNILIPQSITEICSGAFMYSSLVNIDIPDNVTSLGWTVFSGCKQLKSATIGKGVSYIEMDGDVFYHCSSLESISISPYNSSYSSNDGVVYNKTGTELVLYPRGKSGDFIVPDGVDTIGYNAFGYCTNLSGIVIPQSVVTIGFNAFNGCSNLKNILIGNGVKTIGGWAFYSCDNLCDIYYRGDESLWNQISIRNDNEPLINASRHYNASWCIIKYDANGGELAPEQQIKISNNIITLSTICPVRSGYTFTGWAEGADASETKYQPGDSYTDEADVTLYAVWNPDPVDGTLTIGSGRIANDGKVSISVTLSEGSTVTAMQFKLTYDGTRLKLESCEAGTEMQEGPTVNTDVSGEIYFAWEDVTPYQSSEPVLNLAFSAVDGASGTVKLTIDTSPKELVFYGTDLNRLNVDTEDGTVEIIPYSTGDVNMDGDINIFDCSLIRRYAAGLHELSDMQKVLADVNGDGKINVIDVNLVRRYVVKLITSFPVSV